MEMLIPGLCGLVVILGLVAVFMSRINWSIPQMILVGFILLASLVFFYFSARTFVLAKNWNEELKSYVAAIDQVENGKTQGNQIIEKGIEQLKQDRDRAQHQVEVALAGRGRVWHEASVVRANADTGEISATVDDPTPHGIDVKTTLFVFEQDPKANGGKYLGEFTVTAAKEGDKLIKMAPSLALSQGELTQISRARGHLDLYEIMPADSHALFAQLDNRDDVVKASFPADVQSDYIRDFTAANENDPPDRVYRWVKFTKEWSSDKVPADKSAVAPPAAPAAQPGPPAAAPAPGAPAAAAGGHVFKPGDVALFDPQTAAELVDTKMVAVYDIDRKDKGKVFVRELQDFAQMFRESVRQRSELLAEIADIAAQANRLDAAQTEVLADVEAITKEREGLKKDLAKFQAERDAATAYVAALGKRNEELRADLSKTFRDNIRMAAQLDEMNHRLLEEINRRNPPVQAQASLGPAR
jgi:hypothetical protein